MSKSRSKAIKELNEAISKKLQKIDYEIVHFETSPNFIDLEVEEPLCRMRNRLQRLEIIQQCLDDKKVSGVTENKTIKIANQTFVDQLEEFVKKSAKGKDNTLEALTILQDICDLEMGYVQQKIKSLSGDVFEKAKKPIILDIRTTLDSPRTPRPSIENTPSSSPRPSLRRNLASRGLFDTPKYSPTSSPRSSLINDEKSMDNEGSGYKVKTPAKNPSKD